MKQNIDTPGEEGKEDLQPSAKGVTGADLKEWLYKYNDNYTPGDYTNDEVVDILKSFLKSKYVVAPSPSEQDGKNDAEVFHKADDLFHPIQEAFFDDSFMTYDEYLAERRLEKEKYIQGAKSLLPLLKERDDEIKKLKSALINLINAVESGNHYAPAIQKGKELIDEL